METELTAARHLANRLETQLYAQEQDTANLRKENQQLNKFKKDMEKKLAGEVGFQRVIAKLAWVGSVTELSKKLNARQARRTSALHLTS